MLKLNLGWRLRSWISSSWRSPSKARRRKQTPWRAENERLEDRRMLIAPVAVNDNYGTIYVDSYNVIFTSGVLQNDEGDFALTAELQSDVSHGNLSLNADGSFTYIANGGYTGNDSVSYRAFDGSQYSNVATVSFVVDKPIKVAENLDDRPSEALQDLGGFSVSGFTGELSTQIDVAPGVTWWYSSLTDPHPVLRHESTRSQAASFNVVDVRVAVGGIASSSIYYTGIGNNFTDAYRYVNHLSVSSLATGRYNWQMTLGAALISGGSGIRVDNGSIDLVNRGSSVYGKGWSVSGADQLIISANGVLYVSGTNETGWFASASGGSYTSPLGDMNSSTLVKNANNTYTLTDKFGNVQEFGTTGLLTSRRDYHGTSGNVTSYAYIDANFDGIAAELSTIRDSYGRAVTLAYTSGRVSSVTDYASHVTSFTYDTSGRLTKITQADPDGAGTLTAPETQYTYSGSTFLLTSIVDPVGRTTSFTYDAAARLSSITYPNSDVVGFQSYVSAGLPTSGGTVNNPATALKIRSGLDPSPLAGFGTSTSLGVGAKSLYDRYGNLNYFEDGLGNKTTYTRDSNGRVTAVTQPDPDGSGPLGVPVINLTYDTLGNITRITNTDGTYREFTYDSLSRVLTATDKLANNTLFASRGYSYDSNGDLWTSTDPLGRVTTYTYNARGFVTQITQPDPDGTGPLVAPDTVYNYDSFDRLIGITLPGGATQSYTWDTADNLLTFADELGRVTAYTYDALNRRITITQPDPDGAGGLTAPVQTVTYNAAGEITQVTRNDPDAAGPLTAISTLYEYDLRGRLNKVQESDADGTGRPTTEYAYDARNRLVSVKDPLNRVTTYTYNANDRLLSVTQPDPDGAGPLTASVTSYSRDNLNRVTQVSAPLGRSTTYQYDIRGNIIKVTQADPDGAGSLTSPVTNYTYDMLGRILTKTDPLGFVTGQTWDAAGNLLTITQPDPDGTGPLTSPVTTYTYDSLDRVTQVSDPLGRVTSYTYDVRSRITKVTQPDPDGAGPLVSPETTYTYDAASQVTAVTGPLNRTTSYAYDALGRVTSVTEPDPDGAGGVTASVTTYTYDGHGRLIRVTDPLNRQTNYTYDTLDRVLTVTQPDPDGAGSLPAPVFTYVYNKGGEVTSVTDVIGRVTSYTYDNMGRMLTVTQPDPDGAGSQPAPVTTYAYNAASEVTTVTDPLNRQTAYAYDNLGPVTSVTQPDPDGAGSQTSPVTSYTYDANSRITSQIDALGRTTSYGYDNLGRLKTVTQPDPDAGGPATSPVTTYTYDAAGQLLSVTDPLNRVTAYAYDALGRLKTLTEPDPDGAGYLTSPVTTYNYNAASELTSKVDALSRTTSYSYDNMGRLLTVTQPDPDGAGSLVSPVTTYAYDKASQVSSVTTNDPDGAGPLPQPVTSYTYDALGRVTKVTYPDPDGSGSLVAPDIEYMYDSAGRVATYRNELDKDTTYTYDNLDRVLTVTQPDPDGAGPLTQPVTTFTYDLVGNILSLKDPNNNTTTYTYDNLNRRLTDTNQLGGVRTSVYDAVGNVTSYTDRNGRVTEYSYDGLDRATSEVWKISGSTVRTLNFSYDAASQLTSTSDNDTAYAFTYDNLGRVKTVTNAGTSGVPTVVITNWFDAFHRRTQASATINGTADYKTTFTYDALDRTTKIQQTGQAGGNTVATKRVDLYFNAAGERWYVNRYADTAGTQQVGASTSTFDQLGRLTALDHKKGTTNLANYTWTYDAHSRITNTTNKDGSSSYTYDTTDQLTAATHSYQTNESYTYDVNGNRTSGGHTIGTNNRLTSDGTYNYTYDSEGNRTRKTKISDGSYVDYTWDHRNRLTAVAFKTSSGTLTKQVAYGYDTFDRRVRKSVDDDGNGTVDRTERYVYDFTNKTDGNTDVSLDDVVLTFDGSGALTHRYLHGADIDELFADETATGAVLWALDDEQGTIRDWAEYNSGTNTTTVTDHLKYDSFGRITSQSNGSHTVVYAFTGREWDKDVDLQYNRMRWYDPVVGRWISEDPIGFAGGDANLVRYVGNNATNYEDPSGLIAGDGDDWGINGGQNGLWGSSPERTPNSLLGGFDFNEYQYYLFNPSQMDTDLEWGSYAAWTVAGLASSMAGLMAAAGIATTAQATALISQWSAVAYANVVAMQAQMSYFCTVVFVRFETITGMSALATGERVLDSIDTLGNGWAQGHDLFTIGESLIVDAMTRGDFGPVTSQQWKRLFQKPTTVSAPPFDGSIDTTQVLTTRPDIVVGHHSFPKFMGGKPDQEPTDMRESTHIMLHKLLNNFLFGIRNANGNHMRPQRNNSGPKIQGNFSPEERQDAMAEFYKRFYDWFPNPANDFFNQHPHLR